MISRRGNIENFIGRAVFVSLFFLLLFAYSENSETTTATTSPYKFASELQSNAAATAEVHSYTFLKSLLPLIDNLHPKQFNEGLRIIAVNSSIHQRIISLQKAGLIIKPFVFQGLYTCFHFIDTDDLPLLS